LLQLAPDFESWATTTDFTLTTHELVDFLKETAERFFEGNLTATLSAYREIKLACQDLQSRKQGLDLELRANIESLLGLTEFVDYVYANGNLDIALEHYQQGLELWQQGNNLQRQGQLLGDIAFCYYLKAFRHREINHPDWQATRHYLRQSLEVFEQAQRPDLVANSILSFGKVLRRLQDWEQLQTLAQKALQLHQTENRPIELAQDYGFLAEVALAKKRWTEAKEFAQKALDVLSAVPSLQSANRSGAVYKLPDKSVISSDLSRYRFILGQAQQHLDQPQEAIRNLEAAKRVGSPEHDTQLYLDILFHLQKLYFEQKEYLKAFDLKLERQSIEQQYGFRAFVGAGRIQPQRQAKSALTQLASQENIAPEITASGRQLDVERLVRRIGEPSYKLIVIHGQSGVGKSSLVNGGLVPALKQKAIGTSDVLPVPMRVYTSWVGELGKLLAEALLEKGIDLPTPLDSEAAILEQLQQGESRHLRTVLIFDQFEEFFFVYPTTGERRRFFEFLGECLNILPVKVILSLREDYLHYLLECERLDSMKMIGNDILTRNVRYGLGNFSVEDAKAIVERLTERTYFHFHLEPALIEQLVRDLASNEGEVRPIELQIVGAQLQAENITKLAEYQVCGRKEELVKRYLAEVVKDCGDENEEAAELVLYLLTDEKGTRPLKTSAELERELQTLTADFMAEASRLEASRLDLVLKIFVDSGLVLLLPELPADRYQLVHDYLAAFIRQQQEPRLKELIAELQKERKQRQQAEAQRKQTEEALKLVEQAQQILAEAKKKAEQMLEEAKEASRLETEGTHALQQFEYSQLDALLSAVRSGKDLQVLVKDGRPLEKYPTISPLAALRTILDNIRERNQIKVEHEVVWRVSFSPDGRKIVTIGVDGIARLWDLSGQKLAEFSSPQEEFFRVSFSPNGQQVATAGRDGKVWLWNLSGQQLGEFRAHQTPICDVCFSPDGQQIATAGADSTARLWDLSGQQLAEFRGHQGVVWSVIFSPDGSKVATAERNSTVRLWKLSGEELEQFWATTSTYEEYSGIGVCTNWDRETKALIVVTTLENSPAQEAGIEAGDRILAIDGHLTKDMTPREAGEARELLKGKADTSVAIQIARQGRSNFTLLLAQAKFRTRFAVIVEQIDFSPDSKQIAIVGNDGVVRLWHLSGEHNTEFKAHLGSVFDVSFSPNGKQILTASKDGTARLWNLSGRQLAEFKGHQGRVFGVAFSPDGRQVATASGEGTVRLWNVTGQQLTEFKVYQDNALCVSLSPDGKQIATASSEDTIAQLWSLSGQQLVEFRGHQNPVRDVSFSSDGKLVATTSEDYTARLWNLSGKQLAEFRGHQAIVFRVSFSPDVQRIATASGDGTARLWNLAGEQLTEFRGHKGTVWSVRFSPNGRQIVTAGRDGTVRLWKLSGEQLAEFRGHKGVVWDVSVSPDGRQIATAGGDGTAQLWSFAGEQLVEYRGHQGSVDRINFSPDGKQIGTVDKDGTVRLWSLSGQQLSEFRGYQAITMSFSSDSQKLFILGQDGTIRLLPVENLDLYQLLARGCNWLHDYLKNNPTIREQDRHLCDDIVTNE
ncbi:PDZ domain-containing protein, partial [Trichocoleus sp. Lan]|uniref:nSTAND1 domain-containing NTPase n=1 Tax=Trichocoleus sp. Lan TaxID=2933927 RepID=UPI0032979232